MYSGFSFLKRYETCDLEFRSDYYMLWKKEVMDYT